MYAWKRWFEPPHHLLFCFVAVAVLLVGAMLWLGWQLARQDGELAAQRLQERRENAADLAVADLQKSLSQAEERMTGLASIPPQDRQAQAAVFAGALPDDCLLALLRPDDAEAFPSRRLPFYPVVATSPGPSPSLFTEAERLEFREEDAARAVAVLRELARSPDPKIRAAALLRLARNYRKQNRWGEALAAYQELSTLESVQVEMLPSDLIARQARLRILEQVERTEEARQEATRLLDALRERRWRLTRGAYEFYTEEAQRVLGQSGMPAEEAGTLALASVAEALYREWRGDLPGAGRRLLWEMDQPLLAIWRDVGESMIVLLLGPKWLESQLVEGRGSTLAKQGVAVGLTDAEGKPVFGVRDAGRLRQTIRPASVTQLPWNVYAVTTNPESVLGPARTRRRLLTSVLVLISALILSGAYLVGRAMTRELTVSRLQSDFVSSVSHEFRTPLSSLCLLSDLLASGRVAGEADRSEYYRVLVRESQRLRRLVEGLLNFGRMEAGAMQYRFETIDPAELALDVARDFEREAEASGSRVEVTAGNDTPLVTADRTALGSAIWNLLDNAVKYSPSSARVWIDVGQEDGRAAIRVRDQGPGIPASERRSIFEKFTRGAAAREGGIRGTGIGLAMVKRIMGAHGGQVRLESEPGRGSTFTLLLPGVS